VLSLTDYVIGVGIEITAHAVTEGKGMYKPSLVTSFLPLYTDSLSIRNYRDTEVKLKRNGSRDREYREGGMK
jgi:hypothetical protein